jgi:hypothetical protein
VTVDQVVPGILANEDLGTGRFVVDGFSLTPDPLFQGLPGNFALTFPAPPTPTVPLRNNPLASGTLAEGVIAGVAFLDVNGDGVPQDDEGRLEDAIVVVELDTPDGLVEVARTTTDKDGNFVLTGLAPGNYRVRVSTQMPGQPELVSTQIRVSVTGGSANGTIQIGVPMPQPTSRRAPRLAPLSVETLDQHRRLIDLAFDASEAAATESTDWLYGLAAAAAVTPLIHRSATRAARRRRADG